MPPKADPNPLRKVASKPSTRLPSDEEDDVIFPDPFPEDFDKPSAYRVAPPPKPAYNTPATQKAIEELTAKLVSAIEARVPADRINEILYPQARKTKQTGFKGLLETVVGFDIIPDKIPLTRYLPGRDDTNIGTPGQFDFKPIQSLLVPTIGAITTGRTCSCFCPRRNYPVVSTKGFR